MDNRHNPTYRKCKGTSKRSKLPCTARAMDGSDYCYHHGGASLKGEALPQFKTGKHSKYLPARLAAIYEDIESDLEASILSRNIKLRESLIRERLSWLEDAPDSAQVWVELRTLIDDVHLAYSRMDDGKMALTLMKINRVIDERNLYHQSAAEIRKDLNEQRNDTNAKATITQKSESMISAPELMAFMGAFLAQIAQIVSSKKELQLIHDAAYRLSSAKQGDTGELTEAYRAGE